MTGLEGDNCHVVYYTREEFKPDMLVDLYKFSVEDGDLNKTFWGFDKPDLISFMQYFTTPGVVLLVILNKDLTDCVGYTWFTDIAPGFKAHTSIYIRKKYRKQLTDEASKLSIDLVAQQLGITDFWAHTPWKDAYKLSLRLGFKDIVVIPEYVQAIGKIENYYITHLKRG
jgi:hypothetical protein